MRRSQDARLQATLSALLPHALNNRTTHSIYTTSDAGSCSPMEGAAAAAVRVAVSAGTAAGQVETITRVAIIGLGRQGSTICDEMPPGSPPYGIAGACQQSSVLQLVGGADTLADKRSAFQRRWGREIPGEMRSRFCDPTVLMRYWRDANTPSVYHTQCLKTFEK